MDDGDFLDLDWCGENEHSPLVIMIHGLTGCSRSKYVLGLQKTLSEKNWQTVAVNLRGCGGVPNHLPRSYHSGDSEELRTLLTILRARFPKRPLIAVGFSLGGNILLKYQGEEAANSLLTTAVAVSVPFRLDICANRMNYGFSKIYRNRFLNELYSQIDHKIRFLHESGWADRAEPMETALKRGRAKTFEEFDHWFTAPLHGFASGEEYYELASCKQYLKDIKKPTLIVHSKDDPFMSHDVIPKTSELSSDIHMELTDHGGHVGFIGGSLAKPVYWLEQRISDWLDQTVSFK